MAKNPYTVLGVAPSATDSEIRAAFRKLAKEHHPDRNPGDKTSEDRFKEVSAAFDILGDAERRKKFDRGEIDADGRERAGMRARQRQWSGAAGGQGGFGGGASGDPGAEFSDLSDLFADLFGARSRDTGSAGGPGFGARSRSGPHSNSRGGAPVRGRDLRYRLEIDFLEAARGDKKRVTMPDGRTLSLTIPAGLDDGQTLRLRGQGEPGPAGGAAGDVYVEVTVRPHRIFEREGLDVHLETPISLKEAVLGGKITVPTIEGEVAVTVPRGANSGAVLRLKGRGVNAGSGDAPGDQYVKLRIVLPEGGDPELEAFVRQWAGGGADAPRKHFEDV
ncbi:MAG: J domain-containing protein [Pseudomonadota bacterium]